MPNRLLGATVVDQLKYPQRTLNRRISQEIEAANLTANPVLDVEKGSGITQQTSQPGAVCMRNQGSQKPEYRVPPQPSQHMLKLIEECKEALKDISQIHEISEGVPITSNLSGPTVEMLQGADNEPLIPAAIRWAAFLSNQATKIIKRVQWGYKEERVISIIGPQNESDVMSFFAEAHQTTLNVECQLDSVIPQSPASRIARCDELIRLGTLDARQDRAQILSLYRFGNVRELYTEDDEDRQKAQRENRKMLAGQPTTVAPFDNDDIHLRNHNRLRKSAEYEQLPPEAQAMFDQHCLAHQQKLVQTLQLLQQPQQPTQTNPQNSPAGGGAPGPIQPLPAGPGPSGMGV
jgi:hypothetical protein